MSKIAPREITTSGPITQIITSKEWVLPPRPKPGRKPSIDTPASKRKAQNRQAQRAFRERRATRVSELEQKLLEVEKENEIKCMGLMNMLNKLKVENSYLVKSLSSLKRENELLKTGKDNGRNTTAKNKNGSISNVNFSISENNLNSPINVYHSPKEILPYQKENPSLSYQSPPETLDSEDCGVCSKDDCLCEDVGLKEKSDRSGNSFSNQNSGLNDGTSFNSALNSASSFSSFSKKLLSDQLSSFEKLSPVSLKRKDSPIDFTNKFKSKPLPDLKKLKRDPIDKSSVDDCGFCTDDSNCVCLAAANEAAKLKDDFKESNESFNKDNDSFNDSNLPPLINFNNNIRKVSLPVLHPGPSVRVSALTNYSDLTPGAVPSRTPVIEEDGCTGNPGTCRQCQTDPMSTLFCTTVANKEEAEAQAPTPVPVLETSSMYIPCADAYKTLSRHKKFNTVDFSTVVGKLTTRGMQVEVQSVANVLRELDRNFSK